MNSEVKLPINPGRVLFGLSRIGYTPESAICDILDNAVSAGAKNIDIVIIKREIKANNKRRNNVSEYLVIDDGKGMNELGIQNALTLGASDADYSPHSLSKFGLGLKSATFSQGDELDVISSLGGGEPFIKYRVSLPSIHDTYFATRQDIANDDQALLDEYLPDGRGTIIRIGQVRREGHPPVSETQALLEKRIGVIYYYFLQDESLNIRLEGKSLKAFDVLFAEEADENGNLEESTWNGREVRWIQRRKPLLLDGEFGVRCEVEVTQLPHPPSFNTPLTPDKASDIRKKYGIGVGNYGFYVYRNKRLISWADTIDNFFGYDVDLYSFRGRILLNDSADNAFHVDVKKTVFIWSEQAKESLAGQASDYKRQSLRAWAQAKSLVNAAKESDPYKLVNKIAEGQKTTAAPVGTPTLDPKREAEVDEALERKMHEQRQQQVEQAEAIKEALRGTGQQVEEDEEEDEKVSFATKIKRVATLPGDQLWQPYWDAENDNCVYINRFHRFAKLLIDDNERNPDLQIIVELFMYQLAISEVQFRRNFEATFSHLKLNDDKVFNIMSEFRRYVASNLSTMCMQLDDKLPHTD